MKNLANQIEKLKKETDDPKLKSTLNKKKDIISNNKTVKK